MASGESWSAAFPLPVFAVIGAGFLADSTTFPQGMPIQIGLIVQPSPIVYITNLSTVCYEHD